MILNFFSLSLALQAELPYPQWAHSYWVWLNGQSQNQTNLIALLDRYAQLNIPVGCLNIDSAWSTGFNNFIWDKKKFPDPEGLIEEVHRRGIKVIVWATSMINNQSSNYQQALKNRYLLNDGKLVKWWHGHGAFLDYTNKKAVEWWHGQLDKVLDMGVDGFKVDGVDPLILLLKYPHSSGKPFPITYREYASLYYRDFYYYSRKKRNNQSLIMARPAESQLKGFYLNYAPPDVVLSGWVGDQDPTFEGMRRALSDMFHSAWMNYTNFGSDIGGYRGNRSKEVLMRWFQLGVFSPLMQNGGNGAHHPWQFDQETIAMFQYYSNIRQQLRPFLYTQGIKAFKQGRSLIEPLTHKIGSLQGRPFKDFQFILGGAILVCPVTKECDGCIFTHKLPAGQWVDHYDPSRKLKGPGQVSVKLRMDRIPFYYKRGSIIPLRNNTILIVGGESRGKQQMQFESGRGEVQWSMEQAGGWIRCQEWVSVRVLGNQFLLERQGQTLRLIPTDQV